MGAPDRPRRRSSTAGKPHALARFHYGPRIWSSAFVGLIAAIIVLERQLEVWIAVAAVAYYLTWPHVAYVRAKRAADPKRAELDNLVLDACGYALWLAALHYPLWLTSVVLVGLVLNGTGTGGMRLLARMAAGFGLVGVAWGLVAGFRFDLAVGTSTALLVFVGGVLYAFSVGMGVFWQNKRLLRVKKAVEDRNEIFASLLRMSVLTHQVRDVEDLLARSLRHFRDLWPDLGFGLVVSEPERPGAIRYARFEGFGEGEGDALLSELPGLVAARGDAGGPSVRGDLHLLPMHGHLKQADGLLVVKGALEEDARSVIGLFLDQVASALENSLLTVKLQRMADTDPLTGVRNRAYFNRELAHALGSKRRHGPIDFSLLLVDINGLKEINDLHGHDAGDRMIVAVADLLKRTCRASDVVVRLGGDEFVVLCHGSDAAQAERLLQRIRLAEREAALHLPPRGGAPVSLPVRLSVGLASTSETPAEEVMRIADGRMYADKDAYYAEHARYR